MSPFVSEGEGSIKAALQGAAHRRPSLVVWEGPPALDTSLGQDTNAEIPFPQDGTGVYGGCHFV